MPVVKWSSYDKPWMLFNRHMETIVPSALRRFKDLPSRMRSKIETDDGDFLQVDQYLNDSNKVIIISHGLEGDSERPYVLGMVRYFFQMGWDVFAWNYRGCGGELNQKSKMYHSGATDDLDVVVRHVSDLSYDHISLIGFSLGANLTLKYLGEQGAKSRVSSAVVFSAPLDLADCSKKLDTAENQFYTKRFLKSLTDKIKRKKKQIPNVLPDLDQLSFKVNFSL